MIIVRIPFGVIYIFCIRLVRVGIEFFIVSYGVIFFHQVTIPRALDNRHDLRDPCPVSSVLTLVPHTFSILCLIFSDYVKM